MSEEKLRRWNLGCVIVVIISAFVEIMVITAVVNSAYNNTFLSEASDTIIKALAYIPWILFCIAILLRIYFTSEIKKIESHKTEDK